jgi:hypothetical protein
MLKNTLDYIDPADVNIINDLAKRFKNCALLWPENKSLGELKFENGVVCRVEPATAYLPSQTYPIEDKTVLEMYHKIAMFGRNLAIAG